MKPSNRTPLWVQLKERCIVNVEERIARGLWEVQSSHGFLLGTEDKRRELASARVISWEQRKKKSWKSRSGSEVRVGKTPRTGSCRAGGGTWKGLRASILEGNVRRARRLAWVL